MLFSFLLQILKWYAITIINRQSQCLGQKRKNILHNYLFGYKIIEKCLKIDAAYYYDDNLLKQEIRKRFNVLEADIKTIKKTIDLVSLAQTKHFL